MGEQKNIVSKIKDECIRCDICKNNCSFLEKYNINLLDFVNRKDLRYSCFLCNKCESVCPKNLSGRDLALDMRKKNPKGVLKTKFIKNNYKFSNNSKRNSKDLLYLGCNYPGFFPETSKKLIDICKEKGIDYSIDCCKKPVYEKGGYAKISQIKELCKIKNVRRLICCCPNCYHFLKDKIDIEVISIYKFLKENNIGQKIQGEVNVFFPCSDRYNKEIFKDIKYYIKDYKNPYKKINCCGLGGGAIDCEKDLIEDISNYMNENEKDNIYTYCSSCAGIFTNKYKLNNVKNFLSEILGTNESASSNYGKNILKFKFKNYRK